MADELAWPVEQIPDGDVVYMRAYSQFFSNDDLLPGVFRPHDGGMSADWSKYATAQETRDRARTPSLNAVLSMPVGEIRRIDALRVEHSPEPDNRAHTDILDLPEGGEELTEIRLRLLRISDVVIRAGNRG